VKRYAIEAEGAVEADVEAAFNWYEGEKPGLGLKFLRREDRQWKTLSALF
jgi:hypothetical protein